MRTCKHGLSRLVFFTIASAPPSVSPIVLSSPQPLRLLEDKGEKFWGGAAWREDHLRDPPSGQGFQWRVFLQRNALFMGVCCLRENEECGVSCSFPGDVLLFVLNMGCMEATTGTSTDWDSPQPPA